jgi:hypothetical protein
MDRLTVSNRSSNLSVGSSLSWANTPVTPVRTMSDFQLERMEYSEPTICDLEGDFEEAITAQIARSATDHKITDFLYQGTGFAYRIIINPFCRDHRVYHVHGDPLISWFDNRVIIASTSESTQAWLEMVGKKPKNNTLFNFEDVTERVNGVRANGKIKRIDKLVLPILTDKITVLKIDPR